MSINTRFHRLTVSDVRRETAEAVSVRFDVPSTLRRDFAYKAGQHITLKVDIDGHDVRRTYSVCAGEHEGEIRIAVKAIQGGVFSNWANAQLVAGKQIDVLPPMGKFIEPEGAGPRPHYVALAGGSGITPVISIIKTVLHSKPQARFSLLYGNRDAASIIFLEEIAGLKDRYMDRLAVYHFLEDEEDEVAIFNGRLDRAKCDDVFSSLIDVARTDAFFICGPGRMMDAAEASLLARGVLAECILVERFTSSELSAEQIARNEALAKRAEGTVLSVTLDGRKSRVSFDATRGSILDSLQGAGLTVPYACKGGVCTTCRAKVTAGSVTMKKNYGLSEAEVADGYVLTCQALPTSKDVTLSFDV